MIPWDELDERERAVWSATVAARFVGEFRGHATGWESDARLFEYSTNLADRAVHALREQAKKGAYRT